MITAAEFRHGCCGQGTPVQILGSGRGRRSPESSHPQTQTYSFARRNQLINLAAIRFWLAARLGASNAHLFRSKVERPDSIDAGAPLRN